MRHPAARLGPPRTLSLWAVLTVVAFPAVIVFATIASVFVMRLVRRPTLPMTEEVGGIPRALRKLRKRERCRMRSWLLRGKLFPIAGL
jgi:1,4-dihydroxy-2-naphthoate octaprenyltransferase